MLSDETLRVLHELREFLAAELHNTLIHKHATMAAEMAILKKTDEAIINIIQDGTLK